MKNSHFLVRTVLFMVSAAIAVLPALADQLAVVNSTGDRPYVGSSTNYCYTGYQNAAGEDECTLRAAITYVNQYNADGGRDRIWFEIPMADTGCDAVTGLCVIEAASNYTSLTYPVYIDGYTQAGSLANTHTNLADGTNAELKIQLKGSILQLGGDESVVRGLVLSHGSVDVYANDVAITGNFICTDPTGTIALATSRWGVKALTAAPHGPAERLRVGGDAPSERNLISGCHQYGVLVCGTCADALIENNLIGTTAGGDAALPNGDTNVYAGYPNNVVRNNVISSSPSYALRGNSESLVVQGNRIGTTADGLAPLGNYMGVYIYTEGALIGGPDEDDGNIIAHTTHGAGIWGPPAVRILSNSIHDNRDLGIDLHMDYDPNPNDSPDADDQQNHPVITSVTTVSGTGTIIEGTVESTVDTDVRVQTFSNFNCDDSGYGEGESYLGQTIVHTGSSGQTAFRVELPGVYLYAGSVTATATGPRGTSEFSACYDVATENPGTLQFESAQYDVPEDAGTITLTVTRVNGGEGTVTVDYSTINGTAVAGDDYVAASGTLLFMPAEYSKTFDVEVTDNDWFNEEDRSFEVVLQNPSHPPLGDPAVATVTITDDDGVPRVYAFTDPREVNEGVGTVTVEIRLEGPSVLPVSADYETVDLTTTAGEDYVPVQGTVDFAPGDSVSSFDIQIVDDSFAETEESFEVWITDATNAVEGSPLQIDILDDDTNAGIVQFAKALYAVTEGDREERNLDEDQYGNAVVTLVRTRGSTGTLHIDFGYSASTATDGADHSAPWGIVTFEDGETSKRIVIPIIDDQQVEGTEVIHMMLAAPGGGSGGIGGQDTAILHIIDDAATEAGELSFSERNDAVYPPGITSVYAEENQTWSEVITVDRSRGYDGTISVELVDSGTATSGVDYEPIDGLLTFEDSSREREHVDLKPIDDEIGEGTKIVALSLANPTNGATLGRSPHMFVVLRDDEPNPGVLTVPQSLERKEDVGIYTVNVTRSYGSAGTVTVDYGTMNGEPGLDPAVDGIHYTAVAGTLVFEEGETTQSIHIPFMDNVTYGPYARTFYLFLTNPTGGAVVHPDSMFNEVDIQDDEISDWEDCPINAAAHGSFLDPHVGAMRAFRDNVLMTNALGRAFVDLYYRMSPSVASILATHSGMRSAARILLTPVVYGVAYPIQAALMLAMATVAVLLLKRRRNWRPALSITFSIVLLLCASTIASATQANDCARSLGVDVDFDGSSGTADVATLAWMAETVVRGEVLEVAAPEDGSFRAGIHVLAFLKGFENTDEIVVVLGPRSPSFVPGDEVLLFLTTEVRGDGTEPGTVALPPTTYAAVVQGRHVVVGSESRYPKSNHLVDEIEFVIAQQASGCAGVTAESARSSRHDLDGATRAFGWPLDVEGAARALLGHYREHVPEVRAILREHPALLLQIARAATEIRAEMVDQGVESGHVLEGNTIERCRSIAESLREHASPELQAVLDETMVVLEENEGEPLTDLLSDVAPRQRPLHEPRTRRPRR
jgi:hypothetical protein